LRSISPQKAYKGNKNFANLQIVEEFFTIFVQKFAYFTKKSYLCTVFDAAMVESVDTKDFEKIVFYEFKQDNE